MHRSENEVRAKIIANFYVNIAKCNKKATFHHFFKEGVPKSTIYNVIRRYDKTGAASYKKIPGRTSSVEPSKVKAISRGFKQNPSTSVRKMARKLGLPKSTLSDIKVKTLNIKARTKKLVPKYNQNQEQRAKCGAKYVVEKCANKILIIDDETYVPLDPMEVPGRKFFHSMDPKDVPYDKKVKKKTKFFKKYLVWQAMDAFGNVSEPYISEGNLNSKTYLKECIIKRLIPFIEEHYSVDQIFFWPDLASVHYAKIVTDVFVEKKIDFIPKNKNPPNLPQARGIEQFWAVCKSRYSDRLNTPRNLNGFKRVWGKIAKEVAEESGKAIMDHALKMLKKISKEGVKI